MDYMVLEAAVLRIAEEDREAAKEQERKNWKKETDHLKKYQ